VEYNIAEHARQLEETGQAIDRLGALIGANMVISHSLMGRGTANRAGLLAIRDRINELGLE
jgi:hypothetical protein|tara:strand:+ start:1912 stop:2094 length:183 start_codon:yes stop_codon:yes gene_type:complete